MFGIRTHRSNVLAGCKPFSAFMSGVSDGVVVTIMSVPSQALYLRLPSPVFELLGKVLRGFFRAIDVVRPNPRLGDGAHEFQRFKLHSCLHAVSRPDMVATRAFSRARYFAATAPAAAVRTSVR